MNSYDLFSSLYKLDLIEKERYPKWWPNSGEFSVVISAILTQQSRWEKVERSLENLRNLDLLDPQKLATKEHWHVAQAIVPSGLYNQKAERIRALCQNILEDFQTVENFREKVTRVWLLGQKGIGEESADSILNYFCLRPTMVVDSYTNRLLRGVGFTFESYGEIKEWLESGIEENLENLKQETGLNHTEIYMLFHGMIVEYCKNNCKKGDISPLKTCKF